MELDNDTKRKIEETLVEFEARQRELTLDAENRELRNEISRHHEDFRRIQDILNDWHAGVIFTDTLVRQIENIVG